MKDTEEQEDRDPAHTGALSYRQILRSTSIIGLSYAVIAVISMVRMKSLAILLGPAGIGLVGLYTLVIELAAAVAALGIHSSGVRQISEAAGNRDPKQVASASVSLKWMSLGLGVIGGAVLAILCIPVSILTFGSETHGYAIAALGIVVLLRLLCGAEATIVQGLRRTRDVAVSGILSALAGAILTVALVTLFGPAGIVPSMIAGAFAALLIIRVYSRRAGAGFAPAVASLKRNAGPLLRLGAVFMVSGLLTTGSAYVIRIVILHSEGVDAAGLYQASWGLAALYVGFVLQAMGIDFYPRLVENASDDATCNRLVNEQARVSMLLAGPGVLATMTLASLVLSIFYSASFEAAAPSLRWLCLGMMLRVVAWPIGFIILARDARKAFFWTEVAATIIHVGLAALIVPQIGVEGAGMAFCGLYVCHLALVYYLVRRMSGFRWNNANLFLGTAYLGAACVISVAFRALPEAWAIALGLLLTAACGVYSLREIASLLPGGATAGLIRPLARLVPRRQS